MAQFYIQDLQPVLDLFFPFLAALLSYIFQQDHWPKRINTAIAGITVLLASVATLLVQHKITGNILGDFLLIATLATTLQSGAFAPIANWLIGIGGSKTATIDGSSTMRMPATNPTDRNH